MERLPTSCEAPASLMEFELHTQREREGEALPRTDIQVAYSGINWTLGTQTSDPCLYFDVF